MLRLTLRLLGEQHMKGGGSGRMAPAAAVGGIPHFGNIYAGRVNPESYNAPPISGNTSTYKKRSLATFRELNTKRSTMYDDPVVRKMIDECPYFSLCDNVVWQRISPEFLDPGVVSDEEHQLLLLHSRAYFEKWKIIHARPDQGSMGPKMYTTYGQSSKLEEVCDYIGISPEVVKVMKRKPHLIDDASLIAMSDKAWTGANLDEKMRDDLTGMTLVDAGVAPEHLQELFEVLDKMRSFVIIRKDLAKLRERATAAAAEAVDEKGNPVEGAGASVELPGDTDWHKEVVHVKFSDAITCYDLYQRLGLQPYNGQLKAYGWLDKSNRMRRTMTIRTEDDFFDFLMSAFYNSNVRLHMANRISHMDPQELYQHGPLSATVLTVVPETSEEVSKGRYF